MIWIGHLLQTFNPSLQSDSLNTFCSYASREWLISRESPPGVFLEGLRLGSACAFSSTCYALDKSNSYLAACLHIILRIPYGLQAASYWSVLGTICFNMGNASQVQVQEIVIWIYLRGLLGWMGGLGWVPLLLIYAAHYMFWNMLHIMCYAILTNFC